MGYRTKFVGELKFTKELTGKELAKVKTFLCEDSRRHPEWGETNFTYIDLEFLDDFSGIKWNNGESTYGIVESVNLIISEMQKEFHDFGLQGKLLAQGQDLDDRWMLVIEDGKAIRKDIETNITCPHCGLHFNINQ